MERRLVKISKFLSFVLRHRPETVGAKLDGEGWIGVDDLLDACERAGRPIPRADLCEVVEKNEKRRFVIRDGRIRANQGHTVDVKLVLPPSEPPEFLYHGTAERFLGSIRNAGLTKRGRHHVHLSKDPETARRVGSRRGRAVVLRIRAAAMRAAGHEFYVSENGVWLADSVPWEFLETIEE